MTEQWYCHECGLLDESNMYVGRYLGTRYCNADIDHVVTKPPAHITAMQEEIAALKKELARAQSMPTASKSHGSE